MQKRDDFLLKNIASIQIFLIVLGVFSFAFLISETNLARGQNYDPYINQQTFGSYVNPPTSGSATTTATSGGCGPFGIWCRKTTRPAENPQPQGAPGPDAPLNPNSVNLVKPLDTGLKTYSIRGIDTGIDVADAVGKVTTYNGVAYAQETANGGLILKDTAGVTKATLTTEQAANFKAKVGAANLKEVGQFQGPLGTTGWLGHLAQGVSTALLVVGAIQLVGNLAGWDEGLTNSLSIAAGAGILTTSALNAIGPTGANWIGPNSFLYGEAGPLTGAGWVGVAAAVIIFAVIYKKESQKVVNFQCLPFEAPVGGEDCEECNKDPFRPCSEYRCRSLGQTCELVNQGTTDEKCVAVNPNDAVSPTITPWEGPLTENHRYTNPKERPASRGTRIAYNNNANGCLQAFTPLVFGISTNEPSQCKIDLEHKDTYEEMQFFFGNTNFYLYNHTQQFSLPSPDAINTELPELDEDGEYDFFVRCRDKNGNENVDEYVVQLCVDPSPDTTAPVIVETSIPTDSFVKFGAQSVPVEFYVNEPASCKWSTTDKEYSVMENTMSCATSLTQINARELYTCKTSLSGIVDRQTTNFFIRCKDQPNKPEEDRNVNVVSYKYNLKGSQPLNIIFTGPNGTTTGNTNTVPVNLRVVTDDGSNEGVAACSFSSSGLPNSYVAMFDTGKVEHTQRLDLQTGNYNYKFRCVDAGGNAAEAEVSFSVIVDTAPPMVTRAYRDSSQGALKIVTNEDAICSYSLNSCNFNFLEGIEMLYISTSNKKSHYAEWKPNIAYYIKCKDTFGNEPGPNSCSLVASATNIK